MASINGYYCQTKGLAILLFESEDPDKMDRSVQPVYLNFRENEQHSNRLNSFMDKNCDAFYTSQKRLTRFPGLVWCGEKGVVYDVVMTGTPPNKMKWVLRTEDPTNGLTVRINYPSALSRSIMKDGEEVPYTDWIKKSTGLVEEDGYGPVTQEFCGQNRFIGVKSILEFYINGEPDCTLQIQPRDAIQTKVRMEWTMDEFFDNGGTTAFIDRLCGSLGIHASTVKVVGVAPGSINVDYEILPSEDEPLSLDQIQAKQTEQFATGAVDLGAPILDVEGNGEKVVSDGVAVAPGFTPKVLVVTSTNQGAIVWIDWLEPFCWAMFQNAVIEAPAMIFYNFISFGLVWVWDGLAQEIGAFAEAEGIKTDMESHVPQSAPTEGGGLNSCSGTGQDCVDGSGTVL